MSAETEQLGRAIVAASRAFADAFERELAGASVVRAVDFAPPANPAESPAYIPLANLLSHFGGCDARERETIAVAWFERELWPCDRAIHAGRRYVLQWTPLPSGKIARDAARDGSTVGGRPAAAFTLAAWHQFLTLVRERGTMRGAWRLTEWGDTCNGHRTPALRTIRERLQNFERDVPTWRKGIPKR